MYPQKHWFNGAGWEMAKHGNNEVRKVTKNYCSKCQVCISYLS
jgi:hypothetical protein